MNKKKILILFRPKEEILKEAKQRLGEIGYSVTRDNCQNFVSKVRNGVSRSPEIENVKTGAISAAFLGFVGIAVSSLYMFSKSKNQQESDEKEIKINKY